MRPYEDIKVFNPRDPYIAQGFSPQLDCNSCGAAAVQHGMLLGGLYLSKQYLGKVMKCNPDGIDGISMHAQLCGLGFDPLYIEKPFDMPTEVFFKRVTGVFVLACIYDGTHWVTLTEWNDGVEFVDPIMDDYGVKWMSYEEFDETGWEDCIQVVQSHLWKEQYNKWEPYRNQLILDLMIRSSV